MLLLLLEHELLWPSGYEQPLTQEVAGSNPGKGH